MKHHEILGVKENASKDEIKAAYKKLVLKKHPDVGGDPDEFRRITEAYETLLKREEQGSANTKIPDDPFRFNSADIIRRKKAEQRDSWRNTSNKVVNVDINAKVGAKDLYDGITKKFNIKYKMDGLSYETSISVKFEPRIIQTYSLEGRTSVGTKMTIRISISEIKPQRIGDVLYEWDPNTDNLLIKELSDRDTFVSRDIGEGFENGVVVGDCVKIKSKTLK